jgi:outer membrane protein assembly factor BamA
MITGGRRPWSAASVHMLHVLLFCLGGTAAFCTPVRAQDSTGVEVKALRIVGAKALPASRLRAAMVTEATRCRSPLFVFACRFGVGAAKKPFLLGDTAEVTRDAERLETLYEVWGYPNAVVEGAIERAGAGITVTFTISEGAPLVVDSIAVIGLDSLQPRVRLRRLPLSAGQPYALPLLEATESYIRNVLFEQGRPAPTITFGGDVDDERLRASIIINVEPGPRAVFGDVTVQARGALDESTVRQRIALKPGAPFKLSDLERTERELYALPIVARAVVAARPTPNDTIVPVHVIVEPRKRTGLDVEGTVSTTDCLETGAFWRDRYFMGGPRMLAVGVSFSNIFAKQAGGSFPCSAAGTGEYGATNYRAQADLWQPWILGAGSAALVRAFASRESSPNVYVEHGYGAELAISRAIGIRANVQLGYAPERNELDAAGLYFCSNYALCTGAEISDISGMRWLAPLQLIATWSTRDADRLQPPSSDPGSQWYIDPVPVLRHRVRAAIEVADEFTGSDYGFRRALIEASTNYTPGGRIELAARSRYGRISGDDVLPPQLRMYSGGPQTVRGTEQNLIGPKVLVVPASAVPAACPGACDLGVVSTPRTSVRPTGGSVVFEANAEARLWMGSMFQVAAFVDYGRVSTGESTVPALSGLTQSLITPGIGVRVITDLGPVRLDLGYDASGSRRYPAFVETGRDVRFVGSGILDPFGWDNASGFHQFTRRLQLHMAIGQAF